MTLANDFIQANKYLESSDLMTLLDNNGIESDQDWENESTTWVFDDDSSISISGNDVEVE